MKLVVIKNNFQVLLVPNYRVFRITVIYVIENKKCLQFRSGFEFEPSRTSLMSTGELSFCLNVTTDLVLSQPP